MSTSKNSKELEVFADREEVYKLTYYDRLTNLLNKEKIYLEFEKLLKGSHTQNIAFILIDIDNFGYINNTLGYDIGDMLLKKVAYNLEKRYCPIHNIARINSDEFLLIYNNFYSLSAIENEVEKILKEIRCIDLLEGRNIRISASVGIAIYGYHGRRFYDLLGCADTALHYSKKSGKNCYKWYTSDMQIKVYRDIDLINELEAAIINDDLEMYYQPIVETNTGEIKGFEALVRWKHDKKGLIPPSEFIPIAEHSGQMKSLEKLILKKIFSNVETWMYDCGEKIFISINLSAKGLIRWNLLSYLNLLLDEHKVNPNRIEFEFTETALIENIEESLVILEKVKSLGFKISLDDFGTGYSSLNYLKHLPIDKLKLDKTFVDTIENSDKDMMIVKSIIDLGHNMALQIVAEGVEREVQVDVLKIMNCDYIQGYYYGMPQPEEHMLKLIK